MPVVVLTALAGLTALGWLLFRPEEEAAFRIDPGDTTLVAAGRDLYAAQCASCHGAALEGQPDWQRRQPDGLLPAPPHDETGHTWHHADAVLFALTKYGPAAYAGDDYVSAMPAYAEILTDDEIVAVLAYIKSTWPEAIQVRQAEISQLAAE